MSHIIQFNRFPGGKRHAVTLSYDDGSTADRRLVALLNRYGIRGTFCLNSSALGKEGYVTWQELPELYRGHEVACHSVHHLDLTQLVPEQLSQEILRDRLVLEEHCGAIVDGFSYPYGKHNAAVRMGLRQCGIRYARTVHASGGFALPEDLLQWHPTCRHREGLAECTAQFFRQAERPETSLLFFLWGHSYEFDRDDSWNLMETFCREISGREDIWYATNGEIAAYLTARKQLRVSTDGGMIENLSAIDQWLSVDGQALCVKGGERFRTTEKWQERAGCTGSRR